MLIAYLITQLSRRIRSMNFKGELLRLYDSIVPFARKAGRKVSLWLLTLYFALKEGELTPKERVLTYAALAYVLIPGDLLPRKSSVCWVSPTTSPPWFSPCRKSRRPSHPRYARKPR